MYVTNPVGINPNPIAAVVALQWLTARLKLIKVKDNELELLMGCFEEVGNTIGYTWKW